MTMVPRNPAIAPQVSSPTSPTGLSKPLVYPERDGKPMADNTQQFRWIVVIQQNLEWVFADDPLVFVAGDLLWYPVQGNNSLCTAPDIMVVLGRPKGDRGSYKQWEEENIAPQVVFEIVSPSNTLTELHKKQTFYQRYGVEEYYLYDPSRNDLSGWLRGAQGFEVIDPMDQWISPRLQIRFECSETTLQIYRPDEQPFLSYTAIATQAQQTKQQLEQTTEQLEQTTEQLAAERQRSQRLADHLRALGIDPDQLSD